jgi:hypothetical protein
MSYLWMALPTDRFNALKAETDMNEGSQLGGLFLVSDLDFARRDLPQRDHDILVFR